MTVLSRRAVVGATLLLLTMPLLAAVDQAAKPSTDVVDAWQLCGFAHDLQGFMVTITFFDNGEVEYVVGGTHRLRGARTAKEAWRICAETLRISCVSSTELRLRSLAPITSIVFFDGPSEVIHRWI